ncbi:hypothetical protein [Kingella oralis]|uniref:hypothetical protein n=1 Tax=Kingella oralis TaxID=505 RepID=UPI002D7EA43B|nr:hypothetical protein [Kingella oralis]
MASGKKGFGRMGSLKISINSKPRILRGFTFALNNRARNFCNRAFFCLFAGWIRRHLPSWAAPPCVKIALENKDAAVVKRYAPMQEWILRKHRCA